MIVFGLTGGSGAGKSTVADALRNFGVYVIDADKIARQIAERGEPCLRELCEEFGDDILEPDGSLNRRRLGDMVFSDSKKLKSLNRITHKYIKENIVSLLSVCDCRLAAIDGAVIIGSEIERLCDFMISVLADREVRIRRILERDSLTPEQAESRLKSQPEDNFYIRNSDYVIYNNGSTEELNLEIRRVFEEIKKNEV